MGSHNPDKTYSELKCYDCGGTGEVDDNYHKWRKKGQKLKDARIARRETLRDFCKRTGECPTRRSGIERGFLEPIDKYGEL